MSLFTKTADYFRLIKFSHSVFALPFAFTSALIAADGIPSIQKIFWISIAMIGGRSGAMGMNRIIDRKIDALNPRTQDREIPSGVIKTWEAVMFTLLAFAMLLFAAYMLNPLCFMLSPIVIFVLATYSFTKRFTYLCHVALGLALALAPLGAWIAVRGVLNPDILPLCFSVVFWVAGFDILYGLQDIAFDSSHGLHSIPSIFGIKNSLLIARSFHLITILLLIILMPIFNLGVLYLVGIFAASIMLIYEHSLVKPDDLSKLNMAFFNMNGYISLTVFVFTFLNFIV